MIHIPPEIRIKSTIRSGSVYYFPEESFSSEEPHFFIVLNHSPVDDAVLLLVCSSSRTDAVKRRRRDLPPETLVELRKDEYTDFTEDSIVDCNNVIKRTMGYLVSKLNEGDFKIKPAMSTDLVERLRQAVLCSPMVSGEDKELLLVPSTPQRA
jgi:hypothetical protein